MNSITDYIPTLPEDSFTNINDELDIDIGISVIELAQEACNIDNEMQELIIACDGSKVIATMESGNTRADIGVRVGLKNQKDPITGKGDFLDIHIDSKISLFEVFFRKLKEFGVRVLAAIKNFFISIFQFFQSKLHKSDKLLIDTNFRKIQEYYSNPLISVKTAMTVFAIENPVEEFKKDEEILRYAIPKLHDLIVQLVEGVKYPNNDTSLPSNKKTASIQQDIDATIKEIFKTALPNNTNQDLVNETNISRIIRKKYYGEEKEKREVEIKEIIKSPGIYESIISDSAFKSFQEVYKQCNKSISDATRALGTLQKDLQSMYKGGNYYNELQYVVQRYRGLLTTMLYTTIAYWDLYFVIRNNTMIAARAIIVAA